MHRSHPSLPLLVLALLLASAAPAGAHIAVFWDFENAPPETPVISFPNFSASDFLDADGGFTATAGRFDATGALLAGADTSEANAPYYRLVVTPDDFFVTDHEFFFLAGKGEGSAAPSDWKVELNGVEIGRGSLLPDVWSTLAMDLTGPAYEGLAGPQEFRLYVWGASAPDAGAAFDNVFVQAESVAVPVPALPAPPVALLGAPLLLAGAAALRRRARSAGGAGRRRPELPRATAPRLR